MAPPPAAPIEVPGPAIVRADGGACLGPGARADLAVGGDGWIYVAVDAPEGEGIFTFARCGARPRSLRSGPGMTSPAWLGEELIWMEGGGVRSATGPLWEGSNVVRLTTGVPGVLAVVWGDAGPRLRHAAGRGAPLAPMFTEDPPITRASWCPSPPAARAPAAPPPPPARPR